MCRSVLAVASLLEGAALPGGGGAAPLAAQALPARADSTGLAVPVPEDTLPGELLAHDLTGGGRLVVYRQPESALVSIRVSYPLASGAASVRAFARMAQWLARGELERRAGAYGARVALQCANDHASFGITGAARDAAELAGMLLQATTWGGWSDGDIRTARLAEEARAQERLETPEPLLEDRLAARLFPALPAADSMPRRVTASMLRTFWGATFRQDRMQAVVVGRVTDAEALGLLTGSQPVVVGAQGPGAAAAAPKAGPPSAPTPGVAGAARPRGVAGRVRPAPPAREPAGSVGRPQVLYAWAAVGWATADPAAAAVAARLVNDHLSPSLLRRARAELWWSRRGRALVLLGSAAAPDSAGLADGRGRAVAGRRPAGPAPPRSRPNDGPARSLRAAVTATRLSLSREDVQAAGTAIARDVLVSARTPEGLARYLGEMFERTDRPAGGQAFLRQLAGVDVRAVERALEADTAPQVIEVGR